MQRIIVHYKSPASAEKIMKIFHLNPNNKMKTFIYNSLVNGSLHIGSKSNI